MSKSADLNFRCSPDGIPSLPLLRDEVGRNDLYEKEGED
jgi:hypothetical protein